LQYQGNLPCSRLARILHEGNEDQGKSGKQNWLIARRCIAVAMGESDKGKDPVDLFPGERGIDQFWQPGIS